MALFEGQERHGHHLHAARFDDRFALARVETHPQHPGVLGLRNLSARTWQAVLPGGSRVDVPPRRSLRISPEVRVRFSPDLVGPAGRVDGLFVA